MKKSQLFSICTIVLGAMALILYMFCPAIKSGDATRTGIEVMFGKSKSVGNATIHYLNFSFVLFLGFIFVIAGLVITILPMAGVKFNLFPIIALACFVVAALFAFLSSACAQYGTDDILKWSLGVGAIISGILYVFAAVTSALPIVIKD